METIGVIIGVSIVIVLLKLLTRRKQHNHDHGPARTNSTVRYRTLSFFDVDLPKVEQKHYHWLHSNGIDHGTPQTERTHRNDWRTILFGWRTNYGNYFLPVREDQAVAALQLMKKAGYVADGPDANMGLSENSFTMDVMHFSFGGGHDYSGKKSAQAHEARLQLQRKQSEWLAQRDDLPLSQLIMSCITCRDASFAFEHYIKEHADCAPMMQFTATDATWHGFLWFGSWVDIGEARVIVATEDLELVYTELCEKLQFNGISGWRLEKEPFPNREMATSLATSK